MVILGIILVVLGLLITGFCFYLISKKRWLLATFIWVACGLLGVIMTNVYIDYMATQASNQAALQDHYNYVNQQAAAAKSAKVWEEATARQNEIKEQAATAQKVRDRECMVGRNQQTIAAFKEMQKEEWTAQYNGEGLIVKEGPGGLDGLVPTIFGDFRMIGVSELEELYCVQGEDQRGSLKYYDENGKSHTGQYLLRLVYGKDVRIWDGTSVYVWTGEG